MFFALLFDEATTKGDGFPAGKDLSTAARSPSPKGEAETALQSPELPTAANNNAAPESETAVKAGRVTTIKRPYQGETPIQDTGKLLREELQDINSGSAEDNINRARDSAQQSGRRLKAELKQIYKRFFKRSSGVPVYGMTFRSQPYLVEIGSKVPGKVINDPNLSAEKLALLDVLPQVVNDAEYVGSGEYVTENKNFKPVVRYDYFETTVKINGTPYFARFDVEVMPDVNNYRTHQIVNVDLTTPEGSLVGPEPTAFKRESICRTLTTLSIRQYGWTATPWVAMRSR